MGGEYNELVVIEAATWTELVAAFESARDESRWESGHLYSGAIGMKENVEDRTIAAQNHAKVFDRLPSKGEARAHCQEWNEKWGPAFAYKIGPNRWYVGGWCSS